MSKSLKKLIDINRLREFKNKLVGTDSPYVQTGAVDQTVAGTKTFSNPMVGSVTGSSGSCTGNSATATKATGNANGKELTNTIIKGLSISGKTITYTQIDGNTGTLTTQDTVYTHPTTAGNKHIPSGGSSGQFLGWASDGTAKWVNNPNTNTDTLMTQNVSTTNATYPVLLVATADATANQGAKTGIFAKSVKVNPSTNVISASGFSGPLTGNVTGNCSGSSGSCTGNAATATTATTAKACTGNAATATKLAAKRTINGTAFDGTANVTTASWGTARNITITDGTNTSTAVSVNGSANVSLNLPGTIKATFVGNVTGNVTGTATESLHVSRSVGAGDYADIVQTYQDDNNRHRSCTIRCTNGNGFNQILIGAHNESNAAPSGISVINTNGVVTADAPTPATSDNSTKIATTAFVKAQGYITGSGNTTGSSGSCTGNAATATKLAAKRTIALSGAATGTATGFDGSGNITIPVTALASSAIRAQWYAAFPDGAEAHNAMWGGRDITAAFNNGTVSANIKNGTFRDIFPGDYITKNVTVAATANAAATYTIKFIIADLDIWLHRGDTSCETHHVAIVPEIPPFSSYMNADNVTTGGYVGSYMNQTVMPAFATGLQNAFGSAHILQFRFFDTKAVNNDLKSGGIVNYTGATYWGGHDWTSHYCHLMTETMVYGASITASCAADEIMGGVQFAAFRLSSNLVYNRQNYWLGDVVSSANFANVNGYGVADAHNASYSLGVRPFALLV